MLRNFPNLSSHNVFINLVGDAPTNTRNLVGSLPKFGTIRYFKWKFANRVSCVLIGGRLVVVFFYIGKCFQLISDVFICIKGLILLDFSSFKELIDFSNDTLANTW